MSARISPGASFWSGFPGVSAERSVESYHRYRGADANFGCLVCGDEDGCFELLIGLALPGTARAARNSGHDHRPGRGRGVLQRLRNRHRRRAGARNDRFHAKNEFFGPQIGCKAECNCGPAFFRLKALLAIGKTGSELHVRGDSSLISGTTVTVTDGGLLALPSNSGRFRGDDIIVVPAGTVEITTGIQLSDSVRLFAGYGFIYWNGVVRPDRATPDRDRPGPVPTSPDLRQPHDRDPLPAR